MVKVTYKGSKAVKITGDMKNNLETYSLDYKSLSVLQKEIEKNNNTLKNLKSDIETLIIKQTGDDKNEAKEAEKQINNKEKEIKRLEELLIEQNINADRLKEDLKVSDLDGVVITDISFEDAKEETPIKKKKPIIRFFRPKAKEETKEITSEETNDNQEEFKFDNLTGSDNNELPTIELKPLDHYLETPENQIPEELEDDDIEDQVPEELEDDDIEAQIPEELEDEEIEEQDSEELEDEDIEAQVPEEFEDEDIEAQVPEEFEDEEIEEQDSEELEDDDIEAQIPEELEDEEIEEQDSEEFEDEDIETQIPEELEDEEIEEQDSEELEDEEIEAQIPEEFEDDDIENQVPNIELKPLDSYLESIPENKEEEKIPDIELKPLDNYLESTLEDISPTINNHELIEDNRDIPVIDLTPTQIITPEKEEPEEKDLIKLKIHEEIEKDIPSIEVIPAYDSEKEIDIIYKEIELNKEELDLSKNRDLKDLTLFRDYEDYTFTFGQQRYNKEALTHEEIESLKDIKSFLDEKAFETKRVNQFKKLINSDKKLKKQITKLTKEFKKNLDSVSKEYDVNVKNLTKAMEGAKEQAEADRVSKVQTQKLNDSLTDTINDQTTQIKDLSKENKNLTEEIAKQKEKIKKLEEENAKKTEKIDNFQNKLNTVLGIVKGVNK